MNGSTVSEVSEVKQHLNATVSQYGPLAIEDADRLIQLSASLELTRMEASELRKKYIALLPVATVEQFAVVKAAAAVEGETAAGFKVNTDFKLSPEQEQILVDVRDARRNELMASKAEHLAALSADHAQKLVSLKVRVGQKKTTTTLKFEKQSGQPTGLLAHLKALTGV